MTTVKSRPDAPDVRRPRYPGRALRNDNAVAATLPPIERAEMALLLRHDGWSWQKIADQLGYATRGGARASAMRLALLISPPSQEERDAARVDALARLAALWPIVEAQLAAAINGRDLELRAAAIQRAQRVIDSYALWMGVPADQTPPAQRLGRYGLMLAPKGQETRP